MSTPREDAPKPMAERGAARTGAETGGIRETMAGGLGDALEREAERRDDPATGTASTGDAVGGAERLDLGGKDEPGSAPGGDAPSAAGSAVAHPAEPRSDRSAAQPVRSASESGRTVPPNAHNPDEPPDESPIESFGRAVSEVVTGTLDEDGNPADPAPPAPRRR